MSERNGVESIELLDVEFRVLISHHLEKLNYARDCRWTQREMIKKGDTRYDWQAQYEMWDSIYKYHDSRIRKLRKFLSSNTEDSRAKGVG